MATAWLFATTGESPKSRKNRIPRRDHRCKLLTHVVIHLAVGRISERGRSLCQVRHNYHVAVDLETAGEHKKRTNQFPVTLEIEGTAVEQMREAVRPYWVPVEGLARVV